MIEKINISNFAGIHSFELKLEKINILIGPQSSGKSVCAKLLYYFKSIFQTLSDINNEEKFEKRMFDKNILAKFDEYFPQKYIGPSDYSISYEIDNNYIEIKQIAGKRKLTYSGGYLSQISFLRNERKIIFEKQKDNKQNMDPYKLRWELSKHYSENLEKTIGKIAVFSQLFIPAGRSFFSFLQNNIFNFVSSNRTIDPFLSEFGVRYQNYKHFADMGLFEINSKKYKKIKEDIEKFTGEILSGKYISERENDFIVSPDGRKVGLSNSSSGQQESLPLTIILGLLPYGSFSRFGSTIYIEEPEAHIFPDAQRKIMELISYVYNNSQNQLQFVITTHSPYILTSINNMIFAGAIGMTDNVKIRKKIDSLVSERIWLKSEDVCAYSIRDGLSECIKSVESGLINSEYLDSVSSSIGGIFEELIDLS